MAKKSQSSKLGISNAPPGLGAPTTVVPELLRVDLRVFAGFVGATSSGGTVFYTVPPGQIFVIENLLLVENASITAPASTYIALRTSGGKDILKITSTAAGNIISSFVEQPLKLIAGDQIIVAYDTSDVAGKFAWAVSGIQQVNPLSYGL